MNPDRPTTAGDRMRAAAEWLDTIDNFMTWLTRVLVVDGIPPEENERLRGVAEAVAGSEMQDSLRSDALWVENLEDYYLRVLKLAEGVRQADNEPTSRRESIYRMERLLLAIQEGP